MKFGFISLGCPKNQVDTEIMINTLQEQGHQLTTDQDLAELVVVNTCGFITPAKEEAIAEILKAAGKKEDGRLRFLVVAGCLAQRYPGEIMEEFPEVDGVIGVSAIGRIGEMVERLLRGERPCLVTSPPSVYETEGKRTLASSPGWAYLKISEGCDNRCAYCAIPAVRGPFRSRPMASILAEAEELVAMGIKELVLVAQDTTVYGSDFGRPMLGQLLQALDKVPGLEWIRILYAHPAHLTPELIDTMASVRHLTPYLDIPIQHCNDDVLRRMGRGYDHRRLKAVLAELRRKIPGIALRTTVMVGFPGESEEAFQELCAFVRDQQFYWLGAFTYCEEEGTPSARWPDDIPETVKERRKKHLEAVQKQVFREWARETRDKEFLLLAGGSLGDNMYWGRTSFQAPEIDGVVIFSKREEVVPGQMVRVKVKGARGYNLIGEAVE